MKDYAQLKYDVIICDFDGTLLKSDDTVSIRTINAISEFTKKGGKFVISTGRLLNSILKRLPDVNINSGLVVAVNGGIAYDVDCKKTLYKNCLSKELSYDIVKFCLDNGKQPQISDENTYYVRDKNKNTDFYAQITRSEPIYKQDLLEFVKGNDTFLKTVCVDDNEQESYEFYRKASEKFASRCQVVKGASVLTEFIPLNSGKGVGVERIIDILGANKSKTVALGDEINDISMLKAVGVGIAMGNARDEVKNSADLVADTNDNDGVAKIIEKIIAGTL